MWNTEALTYLNGVMWEKKKKKQHYAALELVLNS